MTDKLTLLTNAIRDVPDFPKPGILFKDIAPLLEDGAALAATIDLLAERWDGMGIERIAGLESRGFPFGAALAVRLGVGFAMIRKPGKLPSKTRAVDYELEYGTDRVEMHIDSVVPGQKFLLVDDLLATGGTAAAGIRLLTELGAELVGAAFVIELGFLDGRDRLGDIKVDSLIRY
ncbi:MAG: adenine phosphoribosyltransferase [Myxococcota bacterium]|jgi:adenine phosphoribosyltransferase